MQLRTGENLYCCKKQTRWESGLVLGVVVSLLLTKKPLSAAREFTANHLTSVFSLL
jgi:hypothetical protein